MYPYGSPEWLEGIQTLLVVGWFLLAGGLIAVNIIEARAAVQVRQPKPTDQCKVGMTTRSQCTHCNPKDDDAP